MLSLSPQCDRGGPLGGQLAHFHKDCDQLLPSGGGCACKCHNIIMARLHGLNLTSLDDWRVRTVLVIDECCGDDAFTSCDMVTASGVASKMCDYPLSGNSINELRRNIAFHVLTTEHVLPDYSWLRKKNEAKEK